MVGTWRYVHVGDRNPGFATTQVTAFPPVNEHIPPPSLSKGKSDQSRLKSLLGVPQRDKVTPDRTASRWAPAKSLHRAAGKQEKKCKPCWACASTWQVITYYCMRWCKTTRVGRPMEVFQQKKWVISSADGRKRAFTVPRPRLNIIQVCRIGLHHPRIILIIIAIIIASDSRLGVMPR